MRAVESLKTFMHFPGLLLLKVFKVWDKKIIRGICVVKNDLKNDTKVIW